MFTDTEIASCLLTWAEHGAATILKQKQIIDSQSEIIEDRDARIAALEIMLSPPSIGVVADVPVRDVTHIQMEDDPA